MHTYHIYLNRLRLGIHLSLQLIIMSLFIPAYINIHSYDKKKLRTVVQSFWLVARHNVVQDGSKIINPTSGGHPITMSFSGCVLFATLFARGNHSTILLYIKLPYFSRFFFCQAHSRVCTAIQASGSPGMIPKRTLLWDGALDPPLYLHV